MVVVSLLMVFVPEDTTGITSYYKQASMSGLILQFAFTYTDDNRPKLNNFKEMMELSDYLTKQNTVDKFATYADQHGLQRRNLMISKSHNYWNATLTVELSIICLMKRLGTNT